MKKNKRTREMDDFSCCGGNDDAHREHTQDCPEHGNPAWLTRMHKEEVAFLMGKLTEATNQISSLKEQIKELKISLFLCEKSCDD